MTDPRDIAAKLRPYVDALCLFAIGGALVFLAGVLPVMGRFQSFDLTRATAL